MNPQKTPPGQNVKNMILANYKTSYQTSLTSASIRDFYRLSKLKQSNSRPRPLLVKFLRTFEASLILSKKDSLTSSTISIKRDLSREERAIENALLKERRFLIDNGTERRQIKIQGKSLYVKNKLYGSVHDSTFVNAPNPNITPSSESMNSSEELPSADPNPTSADSR